MILNSPYVSGSLTVTGNIIASGSITLSGSVASASFAASASNALSAQTASTTPNAVTTASISGPTISFSKGDASTFTVTVNNVTSASYSNDATLAANSTLLNSTASTVFATTGSNTLTGVQYISNTNDAIGFSNTTSSIYTDGGLQVTKNAYFSSSMFVKGNLTVYGTQSVSFITSSQLNISTNLITVNTDTPSIRFGGLAVYDSGSTGLTGSILWDSQDNHWIYTNPSGSSYSGGMLISGPRNTGSIGDEQGTTLNAIMKGMGGDHITSSGMFESGSNIGIGTSSPSYTLDVNGTGRFSGDLLVKNTSTIARIDIEAPSANSKNIFFKSSGNADNSVRLAQNANTNDFIIATGDGTVSPTTRLTIASTGASTFSSSVTINQSGYTFGAGLNLLNWQFVQGGDNALYLAYSGTQKFTISSTGAATFSSTLAAAGTISYTGTSNAFAAINGTTGYVYQYFTNTGGTFYLGIERSTGQGLMTNSSAYATIFTTNNATNLEFGTNGTRRFYLDGSTGAATFNSSVTAVRGFFNSGGNETDPIISVSGDTNTGFYFPSADTINVTTSGTKRVSISSTGNFSVRSNVANNTIAEFWNDNTTNGYGIYVRGGQSSADYAMNVVDAFGTVLLKVRGDGYMFSPPSYANQWPGTSANMYVASDGSFGRVTPSSGRYKENINEWSGNGLDTILALKPKTFKYKKDYCNSPDNIDFLGLIAEEVAEVLPYLAQYENLDRTGLVENVRYDTIVVPLIKAIQELKAQNDDLQSQINELKA